MDQELRFIRRFYTELKKFDLKTQGRILTWINEKLSSDYQEELQKTVEQKQVAKSLDV